MSGGSLNYAYLKDVNDMIDWDYMENLELAANRLLEEGEIATAKEVLHLKYSIEHFIYRTEVRQERLAGVLKALEWYDSGDWGKEALEKAIKELEG